VEKEPRRGGEGENGIERSGRGGASRPSMNLLARWVEMSRRKKKGMKGRREDPVRRRNEGLLLISTKDLPRMF